MIKDWNDYITKYIFKFILQFYMHCMKKNSMYRTTITVVLSMGYLKMFLKSNSVNNNNKVTK